MLARIIRQLSMVIAIAISIVGMWVSIPTCDTQAAGLNGSRQNSIGLLADVGTSTTEAKPSLVEQVKTLTETTDEEAAATAKSEKKTAKAEAKKAKKLAKAEAKKAKELAKAEAKKAKQLAKAEAKAAKSTEKTDVKSESES
jgi:hypothetical protein